ncbi:STAS domain-containing protein [Streptomyces sp. NPDC020707]|uniref:STAS domain-containing protein n=1 Tax=Streptomyces sp. NPDC020707 TaxID=3365084 RepID=UPI0037B42140
MAGLGQVPSMESSGINTLITIHQKSSSTPGWLRIAGTQEAVQHVPHIVDVGQLIDCHPSVEHAPQLTAPLPCLRGVAAARSR